jgi:hypothetical protein
VAVIGVLGLAAIAKAKKQDRLSPPPVQRTPPTPRIEPKRSEHGREGGFFTKIVGVTRINPDGTSRQELCKRCKPGQGLRLVPVDGIEGYPDAIGVFDVRGCQLGFLGEHISLGEIRRKMARGINYEASVKEVTGHGHDHVGVNIFIRMTEPASPA